VRKYATILLLAVVIMIIAAFAVTNTLFVMQRVATVDRAQGDVQIQPRGEDGFKLLGQAQNVKTGDALRTGKDAWVELSWVDGTRLKLDPGTTMTIRKCTFNALHRVETSSFRVDIGRIWVRVIKALTRGSKFEVETPAATAGIRGTVFAVEVAADGGTDIAVWDGSVAVAAGGAGTQIPGGQVAHVRADGSVAEVQPLSADERALWQQQQHLVAPYLSVDSPAEGAALSGNAIRIEGSTEPRAQVAVNGQPVKTSLLGRFIVNLTVSSPEVLGEPPTITVVATDRHGAQTTVTRTLKRQ